MKRRVAFIVLLLVLGTVGLSLAQLTEANFNAATGFSGRHGFTCSSCHTPGVPAAGNQPIAPPATAHLEGLPAAWVAGESYRLDIRVTGGPAALPNPAPQGGFEIEANQGSFSAPDDMIELINVYADGAVTYTVAGTQVREWAVLWHAPELTTAPTPATFWLAAMASNGNHVIAAGLADGGEIGDAVDNISVTLSPAPETILAWDELRLEQPIVFDATVGLPYESFRVNGRHDDPDATHLGVKINEGTWASVFTPDDAWVVHFDPLPPGDHVIQFRSESEDRFSEPVEYTFTLDSEAEAQQGAPFPFLLTLFALVGVRRP